MQARRLKLESTCRLHLPYTMGYHGVGTYTGATLITPLKSDAHIADKATKTDSHRAM